MYICCSCYAYVATISFSSFMGNGIVSLLANISMEYDEDEFDHVISMIKRGVLKELESEKNV